MVTRPARDSPWFTDVYRDHYADIVRYGLRRLSDVDASAELAQEVFVITWRRRAEVPGPCLPWLYGVARRLLANEWRARRTHRPAEPVSDCDLYGLAAHSALGDAAATVVDLGAALALLTDADQELLRLVGGRSSRSPKRPPCSDAARRPRGYSCTARAEGCSRQ